MSTAGTPDITLAEISLEDAQGEPRPPKPLEGVVNTTGTWGWVMFRTVYTSKSDEHWEDFKQRLHDLIMSDFESYHVGADPSLLHDARQRYRNFMLEDERLFKDASPEDLEVHFQRFTNESSDIDSNEVHSATWKAFLIVDEKAMDCVLSAPIESKSLFRKTGNRMQDYTITAAARKPEPDDFYYDEETGEEYYPGDPGFVQVDIPLSWPGKVQVSVIVLYTLWEELSGDDIILEDIYSQALSELQGDVWSGGW